MQTPNATNDMTRIPVLSATNPDLHIHIARTWPRGSVLGSLFPSAQEIKEDEFVYCFEISFPDALRINSFNGHYPHQLGGFRGFQGWTYGTRREALMDFAHWLVKSNYTLSKLDPETTLISLCLAECLRNARLHHVLHGITEPVVPGEDESLVPIAERGGGLLFPPETPETVEQDPNGIDQHSPGSKLDAYKTKPDLVLGGFSRALNAVAQVGTYGARKYTPNGWRVVPDGIERYSDAMMRHYLAERAGRDKYESKKRRYPKSDIYFSRRYGVWIAKYKGKYMENDPESGFLHAAHLAWNALARLELILQEMEG